MLVFGGWRGGGGVKEPANKTNGLSDEVNGVTYTLACCGDVKQQANKANGLSDEVNVVTYTLACCGDIRQGIDENKRPI